MIGGLAAWAVACVTATAGDGQELKFWPGPLADLDPRVVEIIDHPCGTVAIARVAVMPLKSGDEALHPEIALELSHDGAVVRRWSFPVDSTVLAIQGLDLLVSLGGEQTDDRALSISPEGDFRLTTPPRAVVRRAVECPRLPEFKVSAYLRCWEFEEPGTGKVRRLAYEEPCT